MKYFEMTAIINGKKTQFHMKAPNKMEAMNIARNSGAGMVVKVSEVAMPLSERIESVKEWFADKVGQRKVNTQEFIVFIQQVAVMTNAGISLREALGEGLSSTEDKQIKAIATQAMEDIEAGLSLSDSLRKFQHQIGSIALTMVDLGEKTGALSESLGKLAKILEEIQENRSKMKKATRMPMISIGAMIVAFVVLIMLVVPKFKNIFAKLGADLPMPTKVLLGLEYLFSNYGVLIIAALFSLFVAHLQVYRRNDRYKMWVDRRYLKIHLIGSITRYAMFGRFMMVFSELIRAGIPLTEALSSARATIDNVYIKDKLRNVEISIQRGNSLAEALRDLGLFENMVIQMVKSGESGGELDKMLGKVADYYKTKFQHMVDNISSLIEPLLMALIAGMVLMLALGIFMPMWDLSSAVKH